jgi:hypothetical protein
MKVSYNVQDLGRVALLCYLKGYLSFDEYCVIREKNGLLPF